MSFRRFFYRKQEERENKVKKTIKGLCAVVLIIAVFLTGFSGFAALSYGAEQSMTIDIVQSKLQYG